MGLMDKLTAGAERAAKEAEKALDKGKAKFGELQIEMQMDGLAKKLGYLVFDFYRGREVDQAARQKILDDLSRLEDQLLKARAEAAAKAQAEAEAKAQARPSPADQGTAQGGAAGAAGAATDAAGCTPWNEAAQASEVASEPVDAADIVAHPLDEDDVTPPTAS